MTMKTAKAVCLELQHCARRWPKQLKAVRGCPLEDPDSPDHHHIADPKVAILQVQSTKRVQSRVYTTDI
jgi:hypothetical protein